jgi:adenosylcobyric acid synthase
VSSTGMLGRPDAVIVPGSKSTLADLAWLRAQRLDQAICALAEQGRAVAGICGGYQMLGAFIRDPDHTESSEDAATGLGLLPMETVFEHDKATYRVLARVRSAAGWAAGLAGEEISGYEIHMGRTSGGPAWLEITERNGLPAGVPDGAMSSDGLVWGCYLHGLFHNRALRRAWLAALGWREAEAADLASRTDLDRLADVVEGALDMRRLDDILAGRA